MVNLGPLWSLSGADPAASAASRATREASVGELKSVYVRCPVCSHVFRSSQVGTYVVVGREPDLCPKFPGRPSDAARLIESGVTMCPACSFAAGEDFADLGLTFDQRVDVEERLKEDGLLKVFRASPPPWLAFHAAEICGKERGLQPADARGPVPARLVGVPQGAGSAPSRAPSNSGRCATSSAPWTKRTSSAASSRSPPTSSANSTAASATTAKPSTGTSTPAAPPRADPRAAWLERLISEQSKLAQEHAA